jgi:hypothetical protein
MRAMTKLTAAAAVVLLWVNPGVAQTESSRQLFTQIDPIMKGLSEITGWKIKRKVPADYISKPKLAEFIERRIKEAVKPEEVRVEALTLKMFGFIPDDYDLKQAMVELMTEQAAAFYDYDHRKLFITESDSSFLEKRAALVHELAHALADQNFSLGRYLRKGNKSDDAATAREAVIEGQATWLMWAYVSKLGGGEAKVSEFVLDSMKDAAGTPSGSQFPVFDKAPLYLRESLIFPYTRGLQFNNAVIEKLGKEGFSEVFERAPVSTQQILQPELYLSRQEPEHPKASPPPDAKHYRAISDGSIGELDFRILFEQYAGNEVAAKLAPHWRGGEYRLYESKRGKKPLLSFTAQWDSAASARDFFDAYKAVLGKKWKKLNIREQSETRCAGSGDRGGFILTIDGAKVASLEGLPDSGAPR